MPLNFITVLLWLISLYCSGHKLDPPAIAVVRVRAAGADRFDGGFYGDRIEHANPESSGPFNSI